MTAVRRPQRRRRQVSLGRGGSNPIHHDDLGNEPDAPAAGGDDTRTAMGDAIDTLQEATEAAIEANQGNADVDVSEINPQSRLAQVDARGSSYAREYRLSLLNRLLIRKIPLDEIAVQLDVSVRTVQRDRQELFSRLREESSNLDANELVGESMAFFKEVRAMAMRLATSSKNPLPTRLASMSRALQAQKDMALWFQLSGVFDVLKFKSSEEGASSDLRRLVDMTEKLLSESGEDQDLMEELTEDMTEDDLIGLL